MAQLPIVEIVEQVPALPPDGMVHTPPQQSAPVKQTSPSGWQPAAVVMQVPPLQFLEQQSLLLVQALLSVVQPPGTTGWQAPLAQLPLQQSLPVLQLDEFCAHAPAHLPATQLKPQHCTDDVQVAPIATQPPPPPLPPLLATPPMMHVLVVLSQVPTQQSPSTLQACAGATQELVTPPPPPPPPDPPLPPPPVPPLPPPPLPVE
jgi:hypothetical protein